MKSILDNKKATDIAKSLWINELSEEEETVLRKAAQIDSKMRAGKSIKIGSLE